MAPARRAPRSRSHDPVDAGHQAGRRTPGPERRSKGDFLEFFKAAYGPIIAVYRYIGDDTERAAALDAALTDLAAGALRDGAIDWEYLLLTARRSDQADVEPDLSGRGVGGRRARGRGGTEVTRNAGGGNREGKT
ncbi:hypothetical protein [Streptomyces sp. WAC02707]|uniref:hypothetical protein n=2 Tax=unclassified Streptomyces TaxID=2593676 RepID=UPI0021AED828|nr:hypothetical protein [Streptomyces sp. WAC02707]